jgi:hypothetical protein
MPWQLLLLAAVCASGLPMAVEVDAGTDAGGQPPQRGAFIATTLDDFYGRIESIHHNLVGNASWGSVLDAGTGVMSLTWLTGVHTDSVTAVTASAGMRSKVLQKVPAADPERVVVGTWEDDSLLGTGTGRDDQRFDVVVSDYLVGAMERFSPYFQEHIYRRLRRHVADRGRLYIVGLSPVVSETARTRGGKLIVRLHRLQNACELLVGAKPYREFPLNWTTHQVVRTRSRAYCGIHSSHMAHAALPSRIFVVLIDVGDDPPPVYVAAGALRLPRAGDLRAATRLPPGANNKDGKWAGHEWACSQSAV